MDAVRTLAEAPGVLLTKTREDFFKASASLRAGGIGGAVVGAFEATVAGGIG
jgi:hypothetical protein